MYIYQGSEVVFFYLLNHLIFIVINVDTVAYFSVASFSKQMIFFRNIFIKFL